MPHFGPWITPPVEEEIQSHGFAVGLGLTSFDSTGSTDTTAYDGLGTLTETEDVTSHNSQIIPSSRGTPDVQVNLWSVFPDQLPLFDVTPPMSDWPSGAVGVEHDPDHFSTLLWPVNVLVALVGSGVQTPDSTPDDAHAIVKRAPAGAYSITGSGAAHMSSWPNPTTVSGWTTEWTLGLGVLTPNAPLALSESDIDPVTGTAVFWDGFDYFANNVVPPGRLLGGILLLVDYTYQPRNYRFIFDTLPPLRQFPRDDFLGGAPRQGKANQPRSIQASARQGWTNAYR